MNTQGIPTNRTPYTFSFACSDEATDVIIGQLIDLVIPITFTCTKIAVSVKETTGTSEIEVVKNGVNVKNIVINSNYTIVGGMGFTQGDNVEINVLNIANGTTGLKIYFIGYT